MKLTLSIGIKLILIQFIMFLYLYSIPLKGLPQGVGSRILFSMAGLIPLFYALMMNKIKLDFSKLKISYFNISFAIILFIILICISCFVNNTNDYGLVRISISFFLTMLSVYFFYSLISYFFKENTFRVLLNFIVFGAVIQVITALIMFINPGVKELILPFLDPKDFIIEELLYSETFRMIGLGSNPFVTGFTNGFALILISYLIKTNQKNELLNLIYLFCFITIIVIGSMIARTTIVGALLAIFNLIIGFNPAMKINIDKVVKKMATIFAFVILLVVIIYSIDKEIVNKLKVSLEYGFEIIYNLKNGKGVQTESTNELKDMYVWPNTLHTYIIGDGYFNDPDYPTVYYKSIDVGYLRLIYYLGIIGIFVFLAIQLLPLFFIYAYTKERFLRQLCMILGVFILILFTKGLADLFFLNFLIFVFFMKHQEKEVNKTKISA